MMDDPLDRNSRPRHPLRSPSRAIRMQGSTLQTQVKGGRSRPYRGAPKHRCTQEERAGASGKGSGPDGWITYPDIAYGRAKVQITPP
jgi:hypothetical protein